MKKDFSHSYLKEFKKIETRIRKIAGLPDTARFSDVLDKVEHFSYFIRIKKNLIQDLWALRNVFAHADRDKYIAEVNDLAFDSIKELIERLDKPPVVGKVFKVEVFTANTEDFTEDVVKKMEKEIYTHVPIYNDGKFWGILSETTVLSWLAKNIKKGSAGFKKNKIRDINRGYLFPRTNKVKFIPANTDIFKVQKMFDSAINKGERLGALIITRRGGEDEKPIGIITAWDLPKIKEYLK